MALRNTLDSGKTAETLTFYHVSTEIDSFKSFFREGAKAIGSGIGGQKGGFFVWSNKKAAENHIRFLNEDPFADKLLKNNEAMIIGVKIPKKTFSYPLWQQDMEKSFGIFRLWIKYGDFLNNHAHNLDIPFVKDDKPLGWNFSKLTGFSFKKSYSTLTKQQWYNITFEGLDDKKNQKKVKSILRNEDNLDEGADGAYDSIKFQILTDWLCQNNPDFKNDYDNLMLKKISKGCALKYTGSNPLPITFAEHIKVNEDGSFKKETLFDEKKGNCQVCPFLRIDRLHKRK